MTGEADVMVTTTVFVAAVTALILSRDCRDPLMAAFGLGLLAAAGLSAWGAT